MKTYLVSISDEDGLDACEIEVTAESPQEAAKKAAGHYDSDERSGEIAECCGDEEITAYVCDDKQGWKFIVKGYASYTAKEVTK